ncbi:MAG TPA: hypothetical protein VFS05_14160 [Gemmatimonadaceae bacterium]|nr:hypothetical protein [Gemmatimonadaceae bacterium]
MLRHVVPAVLILAAAALPGTSPAQVRFVPGAVVDGKVVTKVVVTLFDEETRYHPVDSLRMALIRTDSARADTTLLTTDQVGVVVALLPAGDYTLESLAAVPWKGKLYRWYVPLRIEYGIDAIDLTPGNANGMRPRVAAAPPDTTPEPVVGPFVQSFAFASVPWGVSADSARSLMAAQGYGFAGATGDELRFVATIFESLSDITVRMLGDSTAAVEVVIHPRPFDARYQYERLKSLLAAKYGPPSSAREAIEAPYEAGKGQEDAAIRAGKGVYRSAWTRGSGAAAETLVLSVDPNLDVVVRYESPAWRAAARRRAAASRP